jgi:hypothetical protein
MGRWDDGKMDIVGFERVLLVGCLDWIGPQDDGGEQMGGVNHIVGNIAWRQRYRWRCCLVVSKSINDAKGKNIP